MPVDRTALTFQYAAKDPTVDFTRTYEIDVPTDGQSTRVYFPAYETGVTSPDPGLLAFAGVEIAQSEVGCLEAVGRFAEPDRFPLLLPAILRADWRERPLHQTLRGWERDPVDDGRLISYWWPPALRNHGADLIARAARTRSGLDAAVEFQSRIASLQNDGSISVNGVADGTGSYLVAWRARPLAATSLVMAEGQLQKGGVTLGLTDALGWAARVDIDRPGAFRAALQAPRDGAYQFVIANHLSDGSLRNRLVVSRIVVMEGLHD